MRLVAALTKGITTASAALILTVSGLIVTVSTSPVTSVAAADTLPPDPATPVTLAADALPTVQIDGVVWSQTTVGNTVYAAGSFSRARPAGAASGVNTTVRNNLLAYDITTGNLVTSFAPDLNAQALAVAASPDGSRVYVGGNFSSANGSSRYRLAAYDTTTGALVSTFKPILGASVRSIVATNSTVYVGGDFTTAAGVGRKSLAAFDAGTGALLTWAPSADSSVTAMTLNWNKTKLIVGGRFANINGAPAYGIAALDPVTGATSPWLTGNLVRNGGTGAAITSLTADADGVYGSGYVYGAAFGNLEGAFRADNVSGAVTWIEDCHGDTYSVFPINEVIYAASHAHYCGNIGGFPELTPRVAHYATAFSKKATGTITADPLGYYNWAGKPAPTLLDWYPLQTPGDYTGQGQASWSISGNSAYASYGGEFLTANGVAQQGLVRYAVKSVAPNKVGPTVNTNMTPKLNSLVSGSVRVNWQATFDRDNESLVYKVYRVNDRDQTNLVYTSPPVKSTFWKLAPLSFTDTGLTQGSTYRYRVTAVDGFGNSRTTANVAAVVASPDTQRLYADRVLSDGADLYWRLTETAGATVNDFASSRNGTAAAGVARGAAGGVQTEPSNAAYNFSGTSTGTVVSAGPATPGPQVFSVQAWIRTSTSAGGKIIGFGNKATGSSTSFDRHLYMDNGGRVYFGVNSNGVRTVSSARSYNDGDWHQITGTLSSAGIALYVDGNLVSFRTDTVSAQNFSGFWRVGGDTLAGWTNASSSDYFKGDIDEVAVYNSALSRTVVDRQWVVSGRKTSATTAPVDAYGKAVYDDSPLLYWRMGEATGTEAKDSGPNGDQTGVYINGVTLGAEGRLANVNSAAARFDGVNDFVVSINAFVNPRVYTEESWIKTTSTVGGKVMGFGSGTTGNSSSFDRHVYMLANGKLSFGVYANAQTVVTTPDSYNDGQWHHVVASQGADGMKLYIDGTLSASNAAVTSAQNFTGYWRVGGDSSWSGANYFNGNIDEAAVYDVVLSAGVIANHFSLGTKGVSANSAPIAAFTTTTTDLKVDVDASGSADPDGTLASYTWDFGDGGKATTAVANHRFASSGTYLVKLTVIDDQGSAGSVSRQVTVTAPAINTPPVAAFVTTKAGLTINVDATGSSDAGGAIANYSWSFGDSSATATGQTAAHVFAKAGSYKVTLTVTDNGGLTNSMAITVVVTAPPAPVIFASDSFSRSVSNAWGTARTGGDWSVSGPAAQYAVSGSAGTFQMLAPGGTPTGYLKAVSAVDVLATVDVSFDKAPTGGGMYTSVIVRRIGTSEYRATVKALPSSTTISLVRIANGVSTNLGSARTINGLVYSVGDVWRIQLQATGTANTMLSTKSWKVGTVEPGWQATASDSEPTLQAPGGVGLQSYMSGSSTSAPAVAKFDDFVIAAPPVP